MAIYSTIENEVTQRISDLRNYVEFVKSSSPPLPALTPRHLNLAKGFIDIHLYGVIEYTINQTISLAIIFINSCSVKLTEIKHPVLSLALDSKLEALIGVNKSKWDKRYDLFRLLEADEIVLIRNNVMPTNGENFTSNQLDSIRKTFSIGEDLIHDVKFKGVLQSIVGNRVNVAHGNVSGIDIGGNLNISDIPERIDDTFAFCLYFMKTFENYLNSNQFKNIT